MWRVCAPLLVRTKSGILRTSRRLSGITRTVCVILSYCHVYSHTLVNIRLLVELSSDITIRTHLSPLYDTLLEQNLLRIVEPYSVVEVEHVAQQVGQGRQQVELK